MFSMMRRRRRGMMIMMMIIIAVLVMVMMSMVTTTTRIFTVHSGVRRRVGLLLDDVATVREEVVAHARGCVAIIAVAVAVRLAAVVVEARTC